MTDAERIAALEAEVAMLEAAATDSRLCMMAQNGEIAGAYGLDPRWRPAGFSFWILERDGHTVAEVAWSRALSGSGGRWGLWIHGQPVDPPSASLSIREVLALAERSV